MLVMAGSMVVVMTDTVLLHRGCRMRDSLSGCNTGTDSLLVTAEIGVK